MPDMEITELIDKIRDFANARDWDQFHSPKNLSMALSAETGELLEIFQWLTEKESNNLPEDKFEAVKNEIGDILIYLLRIADKLGINPIQSADKKLMINEVKYPVEKSRGNAIKYTEFDE